MGGKGSGPKKGGRASTRATTTKMASSPGVVHARKSLEHTAAKKRIATKMAKENASQKKIRGVVDF